MSFFLNPRVIAALAFVAVLAFTHFAAYRKGKQEVRNEWQASVAVANEEARRFEVARQSKVDEAAKRAAEREAGLRAAVARNARDALGVYDDLLAANEYAAQSRAAAERTARLATELVQQCSRLLVEVAESADRADSEARQLRQAWPR